MPLKPSYATNRLAMHTPDLLFLIPHTTQITVQKIAATELSHRAHKTSQKHECFELY